MVDPKAPWWQSGVVYQIYPRSFADGNGDGMGDLRGIIDHVDHLVDLGVDAVWLSPFYRSPMHDMGYDVADHCAVDPRFGSLDDFDELVEALHDAGLRLIVDFVPNHVSNEHPWFIEAVSDPDSDKRDWFIWADPAPDGGPPNNWTASFTHGSAWELDEASGQYYLHLFLPEQPDVNWANPALEEAQHEVLRFWLDRGVDGFRIDVINGIGKDPEPRDVPERMLGVPQVVLTHHDTVFPLIRRIRRTIDPDGEHFVVGEVVSGDLAVQARYACEGEGIHVAVNFASVWAPWDADAWRLLIQGSEDVYAHGGTAWPSYVLSNHDNRRVRSRFGGGEARARAAAVLLLTLRGTPFLYQGEELGLEDAVIPPGEEVDPGGRDGCRAPIPWTRGGTHGWGPGHWLPFPPEADARSVEAQREDPGSVLALFEHILRVRRSSPALRLGRLELIDAPDGVLGYRRIHGDDERVVLVNFADRPVEVDPTGTVAVRSDGSGAGASFDGRLAPEQAVILDVEVA